MAAPHGVERVDKPQTAWICPSPDSHQDEGVSPSYHLERAVMHTQQRSRRDGPESVGAGFRLQSATFHGPGSTSPT